MTAGIKANADGSAAIQVGGSDAITITSGLNTTFAGTVTSPTGALYPLVSGTAVTASGTSVNFTDIPATAKRITVMLSGVSTSGASNQIIRLGTTSGIETSGYAGATGSTAVAPVAWGAGAQYDVSGAASTATHGTITLTLLNAVTNLWTITVSNGRSDNTTVHYGGGSKALVGVLDRVRITTVNGTDTFDAGSINILWE